VVTLVFAAMLLAGANETAFAQIGGVPTTTTSSGKAPSSFPKRPGGPLGGPVKKIDKSQPLYLQGDELIYDTRNNRVIAKGSVEIYYNNYILTADEVIYDQNANTLTARGNAQLKEPNGNIVRGESIDTTADFRDAFIESLSLIGTDDTRIAARRAVRKDGNVSEFEQGKFTPCKSDPGKPPLWCISAERIVHDQQAATITYQDAQFEFLGVPIMYLPYFQHADPSVKRRTGFLLPSYMSSSQLGFGVTIPYYFALSPTYDFTFAPQYLSQQGILYQGEWRQRLAIGDTTGTYTVKLAGIDQDVNNLPGGISAERRDRLDGWRGSVQTKGVFSLSSWWKFGWDVTLESDDTFRRF
jgi:LPS-assembly protein